LPNCLIVLQESIDGQLLVQHQGDVDCVDEAAKWTALHYAVAGHKVAMVKQLLDAGKVAMYLYVV
jgi:ankyrin repeat protein